MTVESIDNVVALIKELNANILGVGSVWEYTNLMNNKVMYAVFPLGQYCDIFESPYVKNPVSIWRNGRFIGKYAYLNERVKGG